MSEQSIVELARLLHEAKSAVALTGAGISTESDIPDFRSPGGVWSKYQPVYFDEFMASEDSRTEYWRQKCEGHDDFARAKPNNGHRVLAHWEGEGRLRGVITQNIDGLHQDAGSRRVWELHGTARAATCLDCQARFDIEPLVEEFRRTARAPACGECGGRVKHATISFGQQLDREVLMATSRTCREVDLILAIGSSLVVTPAADLPRLAVQSGGRLVIINRDPTPLDHLAELTISGSIGKVLTATAAELSDF